MPQISRHPLDKNVEARLFELFWRSLTRLGSQQQTAEFFSDLLTATEKTMLAKRYTIAVLLSKNYPPKHIHNILNVSFSTIGIVSAWLKNLRPTTKKVIDRHLKDEAWGRFFDKIEAAVDLVPPIVTPYAQKPRAGKEKFQRLLARSARSVLR